MPADIAYSEVHPLTVGGERYGCHSRNPMKKGYWHRGVEFVGGRPVPSEVFIEHAMSMQCRSFYLWDADPKCAGCTTGKDYAYRDRMLTM